tara:strand:- start:646 stop:759 length:114 start_codon:yes stop_codon:yes gene_type:complete
MKSSKTPTIEAENLNKFFIKLSFTRAASIKTIENTKA